MNENDRLKIIRTEEHLTLAKFGERIGLTPGAVSDMERGRRGITEQTRNSVCREFHINKEWLLSGSGEMRSPTSDDALNALAEQYGLSNEIKVFIAKLVKADEVVQDAVINLILATASAINGEASAPAPAAPKTFEEMSAEEIAEAVIEERAAEKREQDESGRSSSTA